MTKFLDQAGLTYFWGKIKSWVQNYVGNGTFTVKANSTSIKSFTANQATNDSVIVTFKDGTDIALSGNASTGEITINHGNSGTGTAQETPVFKKFSYNAQGHINGVADVTNADLPVPVNDAEFQIKTKVGSTETEVADFTANQSGDPDGITFVQGSNIVLTPNTTNKTITIEAVATAPNDGHFSVKKDGDTNFPNGFDIFSADTPRNHILNFAEGNQINLTLEGDTTLDSEGAKLTVSHATVNSSNSPIAAPAPTGTLNSYTAGSGLLTGITLTHSNGHITAVNPTYQKINYATSSEGGLMSASDKQAVDNINTAIANALTSAITPKGTVTAQQFVDLVQAQNSILSSTNLGNMYNLSTPLVIGRTETGDVSLFYNYFVEGSDLTDTGTERYVIQPGTNLLIVNTGTAANPTYEIDILSGYLDLSGYWETANLVALTNSEIDAICVA